MATQKSKSFSRDPGIILVITYFVLFLVNSLVILLANSLFPTQIVLGTQFITKTWAIIHSMGTLALINTFAIPFIREYENKRGKMLTNREWMIDYFLINFVGVWLLSRFANQLGFGIRSWIIAVILAVALDIIQGIAMMQVEKLRNK